MAAPWQDDGPHTGGPLSGDPRRPPLRATSLRRELVVPGGGLVTEVRVVEQTGSTNADMRELAEAGAPEGTLLVAEQQVRGRGRLDRTWISPPRAGLTFSVLLRPDEVPPRRWTWLPLLTGCAVVEGIAAVAGVEPRLKWPNDVLLSVPARGVPGKICGILVERAETPSGPAAITGIGLNVSHRSDELPAAGATSLALATSGEHGRGDRASGDRRGEDRPGGERRGEDRAGGERPGEDRAGHEYAGGAGGEQAPALGRERLLISVLRALDRWYTGWRVAAGDPEQGLRAAYLSRCSTVGGAVRVQTGPATWVEGLATGIDGEGRLVVETPGGLRAFSAGDVVHVRPDA